MNPTGYRTLVRGKLVQESALCVSGAGATPGGADIPCARDGLGRLTIPGTGLAGALIETAGRVFPALFKTYLDPSDPTDSQWQRITAKHHRPKADEPTPPNLKKREEEGEERQSLWHFWPAHIIRDLATEPRQGVGIRQATGATAAQARALFDVETVPAGETWELFFEIDTLRGGDAVEAVALFALAEWAAGRCWLGAGAARGLGWMKLIDAEVLRLPATREAIDAWPNNTLSRDEVWKKLRTLSAPGEVKDLRKEAKRLWGERELPRDRFVYLTLDVALRPGLRADEYGWDSLSVGGHAAAVLNPLSEGMLTPLGVASQTFLQDYVPDMPVVATGTEATQRPFLPGSGLRGPLRHAASRWWRPRTEDCEDWKYRCGWSVSGSLRRTWKPSETCCAK